MMNGKGGFLTGKLGELVVDNETRGEGRLFPIRRWVCRSRENRRLLWPYSPQKVTFPKNKGILCTYFVQMPHLGQVFSKKTQNRAIKYPYPLGFT